MEDTGLCCFNGLPKSNFYNQKAHISTQHPSYLQSTPVAKNLHTRYEIEKKVIRCHFRAILASTYQDLLQFLV